MLKLGYKASAEQFAPTKLLDFSIEAEKVELDSVFVSDHFQPWKHVDGHAPSSLVWLGALAARTSSLMIGTSVLTPTFRYHPSIVAQAFGTLGAMAPGRVILGIGTGEGLNEVPSTGAPWPEFKERFARMREAVTLISFAAFLGIVIWAWSGRRKSQFDAAARIPLDEDDQPVNLRGDRS